MDPNSDSEDEIDRRINKAKKAKTVETPKKMPEKTAGKTAEKTPKNTPKKKPKKKTKKNDDVVYAVELATDSTCSEWKIAYVGETGRGCVVRFSDEHSQLVGGAGRVAASIAKHGRAQHRVRVVDVVGDDDGRKALETFLMLEHGTLLKNRQRMRDLLAHANREHDHVHPDISLDDQPRVFQLNQVRSVSAKDQARVDAAGKEYKARQAKGTLTLFTPNEEASLFEKIDADLAANEGIDEPLQHVLVARDPINDDAVITLDASTPFGRARELRDVYKQMAPSTEVSLATVSAELQSIGERPLYGLETPDEEVQNMIKLWQKNVHPNNSILVGKRITTGYAVALFDLVFQWCGVYEEDELEKRVKGQELRKYERNSLKLCDHVDRAKKWRDFAAKNDGRLPKQQAKDEEERKMAQERDTWSSRDKQDKQPFQAVYLIFLRDVHGFASECTGRRGGGSNKDKVKARVKRLLHSGLRFQEKGFRSMPAKCGECGSDDKAYGFVKHYVEGQSPEDGDFLQSIVNDVFTQERFDAFKAKHESNRPKLLSKLNEKNKRRAAKRARASSSADAVDDESKDESEDDDDGGEVAPPSPEGEQV